MTLRSYGDVLSGLEELIWKSQNKACVCLYRHERNTVVVKSWIQITLSSLRDNVCQTYTKA